MWDVRRLRYFVVVAEGLNMSRAAEVLNISQSALSRQIQGLEGEIGITLFDRLGKRLVLTAEGEHLLPRVAALLEQSEALTSRAEALSRGEIGFLRVGATPQTIASLFSHALADFRTQYPGVDVKLVESDNDGLIDMVGRGAVHLVIAGLPDRHDLAGERLFDTRLYVLLPPDDPRHGRSRISISELADDRILILRRGFITRDLFDNGCQQSGVRPQILLESDNPYTLVSMTEAGHGPAILSSAAEVWPRSSQLIPLEFRGRTIEQTVSAVWNPTRHRPAAIRFLVETLKEVSLSRHKRFLATRSDAE